MTSNNHPATTDELLRNAIGALAMLLTSAP
jgi:hypothetical protein